ncbi:MAG: hypothetical protein WCA30_08925 [Dermatophilaceae bacterium]
MHMRRTASTPLLVLTSLVLAGCGSVTAVSGEQQTAPAGEVIGRGTVMQQSPDAQVELCTGPVLTSYPPQCGGPRLLGEFSWDDVDFEEHAGVRWTDEWYVAIGQYDAAANTFTLTRPLALEPPSEFTFPDPEPVEFPQLCDDPFRGGDPDFEDPDLRLQSTFQERLERLPGFVESWVSDGERMFNVVVTGDAEQAHADLRTAWPGGLCVEQRDGPTGEDLQSASDALVDDAQDLGLVTWSVMHGRLDIEAVHADDVVVARIHDLVRPWLTPDDVDVRSVFVPLPPR